jgi:glycosyltransferase involved in cell wall biosynthesis
MTVTEAGACGTPSVVTRISGHEDAVVDGVTGFLCDTTDEMVENLHSVLTDEVLRKRLGNTACEHASQFNWDATARQSLAVLASQAVKRR